MQQLFMRRLLGAMDDLHGVIEYTIDGVYSFTLSRRTKVKLTIVGSGRDCSQNMYMGANYIPGMGGGYFAGQAYLPAGTYTLTFNKSVEISLDQYGNTSPSANDLTLSNSTGDLITVATGITKSSNFEYIPGTIEHEEQGSSTSYGSTQGGASLYNGYGKGSDARAHNATLGYFKMEW